MSGRMKIGTIGWAIIGGITAGVCDVGMAGIIYHAPPEAVLKSIAGGLLGAGATEGDASVAALGLVVQMLMGAIIGAIYSATFRFAPVSARSFILSGLLFGVAVFFVMNYIVMPLSAYHHAPHFKPASFAKNLAAMVCFGLIVAAITAAGRRLERSRLAE
jgi:hypothetical protein